MMYMINKEPKTLTNLKIIETIETHPHVNLKTIAIIET